MKSTLLILLFFFASVKLCANSVLHELVEKIKQEMRRSQLLVFYDASLELTGVRGFISSNERGAQQFTIHDNEPEAMVGFGSTHNYSIAASRRVQHLVLADISDEVALHHYGFWRPLFMIAETPQQMLSYLSLNELDPNIDVDTAFGRLDPKQASESVLKSTAAKLNRLVEQNKISATTANFFQNMLVAQFQDMVNAQHPLFGIIIPPAIPFVNALQAEGLAFRLRNLYGTEALNTYYQQAFGRPASIAELETMKKFRFLEPENYRHLRKLFLDGRVEYAVTDVHEPDFWIALKLRLKDQKTRLSDLYLSNIPFYFAKNFEQYRSDSIVALASHYLGYQIDNTYETEGVGETPFTFRTRKLLGGTFDLPFIKSCELVRANTRSSTPTNH